MAVYPRSGDTDVPAQPDFPALERDVLAYWEADDTSAPRSSSARADREFVFYDGPPFANGLPHYGHLLTGYVKDVVPRYRTMRGYRVERRFGWDSHGLPAEVEAERQLGISGKADIVAMGIDKFNEACRESVLRYTHEWQDYVTRQARWVDFDNDYKTLDLTYMESVMWAFKQLWDKGLVYEGFKVLPVLLAVRDAAVQPRAADGRRHLRRPPGPVGHRSGSSWRPGEWLLAWTTTPWTLPSNLAVAVGAGHQLRAWSRRTASATSWPGTGRPPTSASCEDAAVVGTLTGAELAGRRYEPLFAYFADAETSAPATRSGSSCPTTSPPRTAPASSTWRPPSARTTQLACNAAGIPIVLTGGRRRAGSPPRCPTSRACTSSTPTSRSSGASCASRAALVRHETYTHSYPHCWRCRNPLIYKAVSSWFVAVTHVQGPDGRAEPGDHLGARARQGRPVRQVAGERAGLVDHPEPVLGLPDPGVEERRPGYPRTDVYGSLDELERDFGVRPDDLHRPAIDELTRPNPDDPTGQSTMRRVPEVLDCWFESGSMPFAQVHYPFENREWFDSHYPGDFIVEYIGQTRGWFYTLHVLATALFDRPAFSTCVSHGIVLGNDGAKMSKSLRNYPDVNEVFDRYGSDAMRWFLMASPILRGGNLVVTEQGIREAVRQAMLPLWNTWYFFAAVRQRRAYQAKQSTGERARARPVHPGQDPGRGRPR